MKKVFGIFVLALGASAFLTSCQKDYTCTCVVEDQQYIYTYDQETKKEASKACDQQNDAAKLVDKKGKCTLTD